MIPKLISHIETHLGPIQQGWNRTYDGASVPFQVVQSSGGMVEGVVSYYSLGLSDYMLKSPGSDKLICHELFLALAGLPEPNNVPTLLHSVGREAIQANRPYLRGEVIGPRNGTMIRGTRFSALYVSAPSCWPDSFAVCELADRTVVMAWLIPITSAEADFIYAKGWDAFENALVKHNPDLCDVHRPDLTLE